MDTTSVRSKLRDVLKRYQDVISPKDLLEIYECFDQVTATVYTVQQDMADVHTRLARLETDQPPRGRYAQVASAPPTAPRAALADNRDFPPVGEKSTRRQKKKKSKKGPPLPAQKQTQQIRPPPISSAVDVPRKKPPHSYEVVVATTSDGESPDPKVIADRVKEKLMASVNPMQDGIRIRKLRKTAGGKVVLEVQSQEDLQKLVNHQGLQSSGLRAAPLASTTTAHYLRCA